MERSHDGGNPSAPAHDSAHRIGAHAEPLLEFALEGFAWGKNRFEAKAGEGLERVETLRGEESASGDLYRPVDAS